MVIEVDTTPSAVEQPGEDYNDGADCICGSPGGSPWASAGGPATGEAVDGAIERPNLAGSGNFRYPCQLPVNPVDRIVEEHGVVTRPVLRVILWTIGDVDVSLQQELAVEAVDFFLLRAHSAM